MSPCWVLGHMTDLVLSLHGDGSAWGTSCSLEFEVAQSALPGQNSQSATGAARHKLKRRQGEGNCVLHLLAFIFWLLLVAILSLNFF